MVINGLENDLNPWGDSPLTHGACPLSRSVYSVIDDTVSGCSRSRLRWCKQYGFLASGEKMAADKFATSFRLGCDEYIGGECRTVDTHGGYNSDSRTWILSPVFPVLVE